MPNTCNVSKLLWLITLSIITWINNGFARVKSWTIKLAARTCINIFLFLFRTGKNHLGPNSFLGVVFV